MTATRLCGVALIVLVILNPSKTDGYVLEEHASSPVSSGNNQRLESTSYGGGEEKYCDQPPLDDDVHVQECDGQDEEYDNEDEEYDTEYEEYDTEYEDYEQFRLEEFEVAGVNLASYEPGQPMEPYSGDKEPFELFEDFDIGHLVNGDEDWLELRKIKGDSVDRWPRLAFYNDKIASKRWEQSQGIPLPRLFALKYLSELTLSNETQIDHLTHAILKLLPKQSDFCAKPSHRAFSRGVWLVSQDTKTGQTKVSEAARELEPKKDFSLATVARSLAEELIKPVPEGTPQAYHFLEPGIVVEERFTAFDDVNGNLPALEFKVLTFWGRVFVANWVRGQNPYFTDSGGPGQVHRDGTMVKGSEESSLPSWIDWSRVVYLAETLGANKDFYRVDILVGLPAGSPALQENATEEDQRAAVQYVVSEAQYTSSEYLGNSYYGSRKILEEGVRLWIAGYNIGNYRVVPNRETPSGFQVKQQENNDKDIDEKDKENGGEGEENDGEGYEHDEEGEENEVHNEENKEDEEHDEQDKEEDGEN